MGMNDDLKVNFDKLNKACKQANEEWEKMMKENNPFDTISKIAKDIVDRQDREVALEFTKCICELLKKNGVAPMIEECKTGGVLNNRNTIEEYYALTITGLDFTEHDKKFKDEITQLKCDLEKTYNQLMKIEKHAQDRIKELEAALQRTKELLYEKYVDDLFTGCECGGYYIAKEKIKELESELEVKDNLMKIKNGLCGNFDDLPSEPVSVANMLINAKEEYEPTPLQKALCSDIKPLVDKYSDDDLEQIAEHLLLYCKHHREDEE